MSYFATLYADTANKIMDHFNSPLNVEARNYYIGRKEKKLKKKKGEDLTEEERLKIRSDAERTYFDGSTKILVNCSLQNLCGDYCILGGSYFDAFIVKADCTLAAGVKQSGAPKGYVFADAAMKKDIEWNLILERRKKKLQREYSGLKKAFETKSTEKLKGYCVIKEDGVYSGDALLFKAGETERDYLEKWGWDDELKYCPDVSSFLDHNNEIVDMWFFPEKKSIGDFYRRLNDFIGSLPDDTVLINVNCHR